MKDRKQLPIGTRPRRPIIPTKDRKPNSYRPKTRKEQRAQSDAMRKLPWFLIDSTQAFGGWDVRLNAKNFGSHTSVLALKAARRHVAKILKQLDAAIAERLP